MRDKTKAGILSFLFGSMGVHKFYLGETGKGILFAFLTMMSIRSGSGFVTVMVIVGVIQAILLFAMHTDDFDRKYNKGKSSRRRNRRETRSQTRKRTTTKRATKENYSGDKRVRLEKKKNLEKSKELISQGVALFKDYDYAAALDKFVEAEKLNPNSPSVNFNLAVTYSLMEDRTKAFAYLDKAVRLGFNDFEKINTHDGLAYLRTSLDFDEFKKNNYRLKVSQINVDDSMDNNEQMETKQLLEQLQKLADMRRKGDISHDQFLVRKKELIKNRN